jgi:hypothetical protein
MHSSLLFDTISLELNIKTEAIFQYLKNEITPTPTTIYHHCRGKGINFWNIVETDERNCSTCVYAYMTDGIPLHDHDACNICGNLYNTNNEMISVWTYGGTILNDMIKGISSLFCQ